MQERARHRKLSGSSSAAFSPTEASPERIKSALKIIRAHLGMDIAFISEFAHGRRYFRHVEGRDDKLPIRVGDSSALEDSYCQRVVDGRLPELMQHAGAIPAAAALPVTRALPVGAHLSVPIRLSNGRVYGTLCCFSYVPNHSLDGRDLQMMHMFAELAAEAIERDQQASSAQEEKAAGIRRVLDQDQVSIVYQPIFDLETLRVAAVEALARFSATPLRGPDVWFAEAAEAGMGVQIELLAIRKALAGLAALPNDIYITLNISPDTLLSGRMGSVFKGMPYERLGLEITEHASIANYRKLERVLRPLRKQGLRLAVDDAGAGYASLRHILNLKPDLIKLDVELIRDVHKDAGRRAMAAALIAFSRQTGSRIVAEGVETARGLKALRELGADMAQGFLLGRPMPLSEVIELCAAKTQRQSRRKSAACPPSAPRAQN